MAVSTLLSTVTVQVREWVVPLYGSPTAPRMMAGGGTMWKAGMARRGQVGNIGKDE